MISRRTTLTAPGECVKLNVFFVPCFACSQNG
jgi:hypothetical protein